MLNFSICEHRADVLLQKRYILSHLSILPSSIVACQHVVFQCGFFMVCFQQWCPWPSPIESTLSQTTTDGVI